LSGRGWAGRHAVEAWILLAWQGDSARRDYRQAVQVTNAVRVSDFLGLDRSSLE